LDKVVTEAHKSTSADIKLLIGGPLALGSYQDDN